MLLAYISSSYAQNQKVITLSALETGNKNHVAQQKIEFLPGYSFTATATSSMEAYIDKTLVTPVDYTPLPTNANFDQPIDVSLSVGATAGSPSVSPSGAATYAIPIYVAPGTAGMQPSVSIVYNSQAGNGILGRGWNIAGLSAITRVPKTIYHNGAVAGVKLNTTDAFALDGNRMFNTTGAIYRTEIETFNQITAVGNIGGDPEQFSVRTKAGLTMIYGGTPDSRYQDGTVVMSWQLSRVIDNYGNYMEYIYSNSNKQPRIIEIKYTGNTNAGITPYNSLKFYYDERQDKNEFFVGAGTNTGSVKSTNLLREIEVNVEGQIAKRYQFNYGLDIASFLTKVTELGSDGSHLNATRFKYGEENEAFSLHDFDIPSSTKSDIITGDYNGDGIADVIAAEYGDNGNGGPRTYSTYKLFLGEIYNSNPYVSAELNNLPIFTVPTGVINFILNQGFSIQVNADYFGTGWDGFLTLDWSGVNGAVMKLNTVNLHQFTGNPTFSSIEKIISSEYVFIDKKDKNIFLPGDFNGDGASDLIFFLENSNEEYAAFIYSPLLDVVNKISGISAAQIKDIVKIGKIRAIDFNGDGRTELMTTKEANTTIFSFANNQASIIYNDGFPTKYHDIHIGDFNGDGKTDLLTRGNPNKEWKVAYSTGNFFLEKPIFLYSEQEKLKNISVGDFNGDGKDDILKMNWSNDAHGEKFITNFKMLFSTGIEFETKNYPVLSQLHLDSITVADFNGDGKMDIRNSSEDARKGVIISFNENGTNLLLKKVNNGYNKIEFSYSNLSINNPLYTLGTGSIYPLIDFEGALNVVENISIPDGIGGNTTTTYLYEAARIHRQGKGFLGFKKVTAINPILNTHTQTEYSLVGDFFFPMVTASRTKLLSPFSPYFLSETISVNKFKPMGGKRFFPFVEKTTATSTNTNSASITDFVYDSNGNPTSVTSKVGTIASVATAPIEQTITLPTFEKHGSWLPNRLASQTVTNTRAGEAPFAATITNLYNGKGKLIKTINFGGSVKSTSTHIDYFPQTGTLKSTTLTANGMQARKRSFKYDSKARFVTETTNPIGQIATAKYDPKWGLPISQTGVDGLTTSSTYDGYGRSLKVTTPDQLETFTSRGWQTNGNPSNLDGPSNGSPVTTALFFQEIHGEGVPTTKKWADALGRTVRTETEGLNQKSYTTTQYNAKGQPISSSAPFFAGESAVITTPTYDALGRVKTIANIAGTTNYQYGLQNGLFTTTVTSPTGQIKTASTDASGKTVTATDEGGTINYTFYSHGQPKSIAVNGVNMALMNYDDLGNQTKLTDPNAGTTEYNYNAFGELVFQKDAKGNVFDQIGYDQLGRITQKRSLAEGDFYTWQYVTATKGINQLKKTTAPNGTSQQFAYDNLGRVTTSTENIDGKSFVSQFKYDKFSNIVQQTYPSGFRVTNMHNAKGFLTQIQNTATSEMIWQAGTENALGQATQFSKGNGITTQKTYDILGQALTSYSGNVQKMEWNWDIATGNLLGRRDFINGKEEQFTYDNLNRLTSAVVSGQTAINTNYTPNGNISSKTNIGNYQYDAAKINAITKIDNINNGIGLPTQDITYTDFHSTATITEGNNTLNFTYGSNQQRKKTELLQQGAVTKTTYFLPAYEEITQGNDTYKVHYVGSKAIYVQHNNNQGELFYTYTDHLGSLLTLTDNTGNTIFEQNFDAWGNHRNPQTWASAPFTGSGLPWLIRGFTGHEHLPEFALINMNGRTYDPLLGRMLSVDNFVQDATSTQGYNRYSYVRNNPLKYTDPSGEIINFIVGGVIGGIFGTIAGIQSGATGTKLLGFIAVGIAAGALSSGIGAGVNASLAGESFGAGFAGTTTVASTGFAAGAVTGAAAGVTNGLVAGTGFGLLNNQNFGTALKSGFKQAGIQGLSGAAIGGVLGGIDAVRNDLDFFTGDIPGGSPRVLQIAPNGNTETGLSQNDFLRGNSLTDGRSDIINGNPKVSIVNNSNNRTFTTTIRTPRGFTGSSLINNPNVGILSQGQNGRFFQVTSLNRVTNITILGSKQRLFGRVIGRGFGFKKFLLLRFLFGIGNKR